MVDVNVVGRVHQQNDLSVYGRTLAHEIGQSFLLHLLPALADLPLPIVDANGAAVALGDALRASQRITLAGSSGSGRRLALQQWALRWADGPTLPFDSPAGTRPASVDTPGAALLALPLLDDGAAPPEQLLAARLRATRQATAPRPRRAMLARFRRAEAAAAGAPPRAGTLLIHGWDELSFDRRAAWRAALIALAQADSSLQLAVTLPLDEPAWPAFTPLRLAPLTPDLLAAWVERLAPADHQATLMSALAKDGALAPLGARLFEVALLAWLMPWAGLPKTRAELYDRALADILGVPPERLADAPQAVELQLLAAYDERPSRVIHDLVAPGADGAPHFVHPQVRRYLAARQLIAEGRYDLLHLVEPAERPELALLATTMLDDPGPIFAAIWGQGDLSASDALALGRCLRERAPHNPAWALRTLVALARLAAAGDALAQPETMAQRAQAEAQLRATLPACDPTLEGIAHTGERARHILLQLFELLPADLAAPRMLRLILNPATPEPFAWALADRLVEQPARAERAPVAPPDDDRALARWMYVHAQHSPPTRPPVELAAATAALQALETSAAGERRTLRTATALLEDSTNPAALRLMALELLTRSEHPTALMAIERAGADRAGAVRAAALAALDDRDPARAAGALSRTALDGRASAELRLHAIRRISDQHSWSRAEPNSVERILERCALDPTLPLYARLEAVVALSRNPNGTAYLLQMIDTSAAHPEVSGAAAYVLGVISAAPDDSQARDAGRAGVLPALIRQLDSPRARPALTEGCCSGLGVLGNRAATGALIRLIDRTHNDVALTLAAVQALGQLRDPDAAERLGRMLGAEALHRLQRGIEPRLFDQKVDACLSDASLPRPIARRLAAALLGSATTEAGPTTLIEFLTGEAEQVRAAAAHALIAIGGNAARAALLAALLDATAGGATAEIIAALAEVEGPDSAEALGYLLDAHGQNLLTGWLVVRQLTDHPAGEVVMRRAIGRATISAFVRGALAEGLGQRGALAALPTLRQIADDRTCDPHLRSQALLALGLLNDPSTETALIRLIGDQSEDATLRGLAAERLPDQLSAEGRRCLRDLLRHERVLAPLAAGALKTLGRVHDREALPLMLRYLQESDVAIAQAAIVALTDLGDESVAPMLVRLAQHPSVDHALRLQAVGALLRIGGADYRPLLRIYLNQGALPFRLLALEHLIGAGAPADELLTFLADQGWPAPLRLRLLDYLAGDVAAAPTLIGILTAAGDDPHLRVLAAEALGRLRWADAVPALTLLAEHAAAPGALRLQSIAALSAIGGDAAWSVMSRLAEGDDQDLAIRARAVWGLRNMVRARLSVPNTGANS